MRILNSHIVESEGTNTDVQVSSIDIPGPGNAYHHYRISGMIDIEQNDSFKNSDSEVSSYIDIFFQNGPIKEVGVNGITNEALLTILIDRINSFQSGLYACKENAMALQHLKGALFWLQERTQERLKRGVEGISLK